MKTASPMTLTHDQACRLQQYMQTYRRYAFASLLPSTDRNATLRVLQAVQGKLIASIDQKAAVLTCVLAAEEMRIVKAMATDLLRLYAKAPVSDQRGAILADLALLKASLRRCEDSHCGIPWHESPLC